MLRMIREEKERRKLQSERDRIAAEAEEIRARCQTLLGFVREAWHILEPSRKLVEGWALDAICEHFEAITYGDITRLLVNVPPGFMKSLIADVLWPAWEWTLFPHLRYVAFSYASALTYRDNGRFRDLLVSPWYQGLFGDRFTLRKIGEERVTNNHTGFKFASSVGGVGTGERGDRVILDDPHNVKQAESEDIRKETVRWVREGMSNRLNDQDKSAIAVIMQRVHEEDVSGALIELGDYEHLMIPMEWDGRRYHTSIGWTDPRDEDGELAWEERFSRRTVETFKTTLGPYGYAGQYMQAPTPRGGGIFKRDWWQLWGNEDDPDDPQFRKFPSCDYIVASLDTAYTEKTENDYSALTVWGVYRDRYDMPKAILMNAWRDRLAIHALVERAAATCRRFKVDRLLIESKASGISVSQELRRLHAAEGYGVQLLDPKGGDKVARAYAIQHLFADEMIYAPDRDWADMVITEMASFPRAPHDDLVDSATQALKHLRDVGLLIHGAEMTADLETDLAYRSEPKPLYPV
ncbi:phage terminase large subunit [Rhizobium leguminosarum]|nr:phage terminase large subunit [Rhizobium leguminosarum]